MLVALIPSIMESARGALGVLKSHRYVVVGAAGSGSRLAPDQIIGKTTVNAMVVCLFFFGSNL